jgi:hypothetical protein
VPIAEGGHMPLVGLGTWQASGRAAYDAVRRAVSRAESTQRSRMFPAKRRLREEVPIEMGTRPAGVTNWWLPESQ